MTRDEWKITFGDNLSGVLHDIRMSQNELAKLSDLSPGMISDYINGWSAPSVFAINNIAHVLDIDIDELVDMGDTIDE
jgi:transcriptional regulator with XRE-family HTH domain